MENRKNGILLILITIVTVTALIAINQKCHKSDYAYDIKQSKGLEDMTIKNLVDKQIDKQKEIDQRETEQKETERKQELLAKMEESRKVISEKDIELARIRKEEHKEITRGIERSRSLNNIFTVTAYDLSVQSCGKGLNHPAYGLTASGKSLKGLSREQAMTVAADTRVIPMGSKIRLEFLDEQYKKFNGIYTVKDRGGAIKGAKIDLFMGDFNKEETDQSVWDFGKVKARVYLVVDN